MSLAFCPNPNKRIWTKRAWNYSLISLVTIWSHILINLKENIDRSVLVGYVYFINKDQTKLLSSLFLWVPNKDPDSKQNVQIHAVQCKTKGVQIRY